MLLQKIKSFIKKLNKKLAFPLAKRIVFESNPEMTGNVGTVYDELIKRGLNKKFKLVWRVEDKRKYVDYGIENVSFIDYAPKSFLGRMQYILYRWTSKALIFENRFEEKRWKNQLAINLMHGMPIKSNCDYVEHDTCDYIVSSGSGLNEILSREMDIPIERFVTLGYPRTDVLGEKTDSLKKLGIEGYKGTIVWMPTFRKHKENKAHEHEGRQYPNGVPLLTEDVQYKKLNECLKQSGYLLVIKLHPIQETSCITEHSESNIMFLSNKTMAEKNVSVYELLAESAALLTDYSSVYYDYLLTDKPIGLVIDDIDEYAGNRGLCLTYKDYIKGDYIYTLEELEKFIRDVAASTDPAESERLWAKKQWCDFTDFKSTERVADFVLEKLKF